ncbi:MAG: 50S ribosomal protein L10 [Actinobacteria bacterium RBG_19FT_COMBO_36_27]|nr:MAG: 50S ribosomal protein L10 [Actinobacteria bacterium RBG_19FT_COMBO_36_27]
MAKDKNIQTVESLREKVKKAKSITIMDYLGLEVNNINDLRAKITEKNADTVVAKNTLLKIALKEEGISSKEADAQLKGPTAAVFAYDDPISPLKVIFEFAKNFELPKVKFSFLDKTFTDASQVKILSELPSKDQLLAQIVGGLKSPLSGIVNVLGGTQSKFVTVLSRISEKKN